MHNVSSAPLSLRTLDALTPSPLALHTQFLEVIHRVASEGVSAKKGAISLDSLVSRKANAGPPMLWRIDKAGPGLAIDAERTEACRMGERTGPQWGVQLVDLWLGQKTYDVCIACC